MEAILITAQSLLAILLILLILVQNRGVGFGRVWGSSSFSRRGLESLVFRLTFVAAAIFIVLSILRLLV